jgi:hypothetical protein
MPIGYLIRLIGRAPIIEQILVLKRYKADAQLSVQYDQLSKIDIEKLDMS